MLIDLPRELLVLIAEILNYQKHYEAVLCLRYVCKSFNHRLRLVLGCSQRVLALSLSVHNYYNLIGELFPIHRCQEEEYDTIISQTALEYFITLNKRIYTTSSMPLVIESASCGTIKMWGLYYINRWIVDISSDIIKIKSNIYNSAPLYIEKDLTNLYDYKMLHNNFSSNTLYEYSKVHRYLCLGSYKCYLPSTLATFFKHILDLKICSTRQLLIRRYLRKVSPTNVLRFLGTCACIGVELQYFSLSPGFIECSLMKWGKGYIDPSWSIILADILNRMGVNFAHKKEWNFLNKAIKRLNRD